MQKILLDAGSSGINGAHSTESGLRCQRLKGLEGLVRDSEEDGNVGGQKSEPLLRGSIGHVGLAQHYARIWSKQEGEDPDEFYEPLAGCRMTGTKMGASDELISRVSDVLNDYFAFWSGEKFEVVDVENLMIFPLQKLPGWLVKACESLNIDHTKFVHTQRADLVVKERDQKKYIIDHKFVTRLNRDTIHRYTLSTQFLGYQWLGRHYYKQDFGGVKLNFIEVGDGKNPRFIREELPPAPHALSTFEATVGWERLQREILKDVEVLQKPGAHSEQGCVTPYGPCSMMDVCQWGSSRLVSIGVKNKAVSAGAAYLGGK